MLFIYLVIYYIYSSFVVVFKVSVTQIIIWRFHTQTALVQHFRKHPHNKLIYFANDTTWSQAHSLPACHFSSWSKVSCLSSCTRYVSVRSISPLKETPEQNYRDVMLLRPLSNWKPFHLTDWCLCICGLRTCGAYLLTKHIHLIRVG